MAITALTEELEDAEEQACCHLFHRNTHKGGRTVALPS